ncbi:galanin-like G-protein coupled receptor npr-9 [Physella acuta]|uniref:galanin-like G-protein coupled receptor npr-9 n=1 Tax=Physella acuta TaxID=109671 RepID=UPI0027DBC617|nr:galanin-like G-protein coupled receptor npr-9 [Physella acuta]
MENSTFVSSDVRETVKIVLNASINPTIAVIGSVGNVISIIAFTKQGLKDSVTICLLVLAMSDLGSLLFMIWEAVCLNPLLVATDLPYDVLDVHYLTAALPHGICIRVAWWTTCVIAIERCLCVTQPLRVKVIITPRRTCVALLVVTLVSCGCVSLLLASAPFGPRFSPSKNRTIYARTFNEKSYMIDRVGYLLNVTWQFAAFLTNVLCTALTVYQLKAQSVRRRRLTQGAVAGQKEALTSRDLKIVKMVVSMSLVLIVCGLPSCVNFAMELVFSPRYSITGVYSHLDYVIWSGVFTLEAIHSSVNFFVYYTMNVRFKSAVEGMFSCLFHHERQV